MCSRRLDTGVKASAQARERPPARERIHTEAILNVYSIDGSTVVTGSQDRVGELLNSFKKTTNEFHFSSDFSSI